MLIMVIVIMMVSDGHVGGCYDVDGDDNVMMVVVLQLLLLLLLLLMMTRVRNVQVHAMLSTHMHSTAHASL